MTLHNMPLCRHNSIPPYILRSSIYHCHPRCSTVLRIVPAVSSTVSAFDCLCLDGIHSHTLTYTGPVCSVATVGSPRTNLHSESSQQRLISGSPGSDIAVSGTLSHLLLYGVISCYGSDMVLVYLCSLIVVYSLLYIAVIIVFVCHLSSTLHTAPFIL